VILILIELRILNEVLKQRTLRNNKHYELYDVELPPLLGKQLSYKSVDTCTPIFNNYLLLRSCKYAVSPRRIQILGCQSCDTVPSSHSLPLSLLLASLCVQGSEELSSYQDQFLIIWATDTKTALMRSSKTAMTCPRSNLWATVPYRFIGRFVTSSETVSWFDVANGPQNSSGVHTRGPPLIRKVSLVSCITELCVACCEKNNGVWNNIQRRIVA
jgi:hypothetical protein